MGTIQIDGSTPKLTIGNATAEDATILFDGAAQDFYIALDDSADDLLIGLGSTVGTTPIIAIDENKLSTFSGAITVGVDDTGHDVKLFGASAGSYALWDESANLLDLRGATAAGPGHLKLTTGELTVVDADVLGKIEFQAPLESSGTDAILVGASIYAEADDTFAAGVNNTDLVFALGKSEAAAEKFRFTADNEIGIAGANYGTDGQVLTSGGAGAAVAWEDAASFAGIDDQSSSNDDQLTITDSALIINEDSDAFDFRVESNLNTHGLFLDSSESTVAMFGSANSVDTQAQSSGTGQMAYGQDGRFAVSHNNASSTVASFAANRVNGDGELIAIFGQGTKEGTISVSGSTVSYNAFCGSHWSRLADNSRPTILRGTVMESIATLVDWYQVEYDITGEDGISKKVKGSIALGEHSVGDTISYTDENDVVHSGAVIEKEDNERLPMCKISDTNESKAVYGVFMNWDDEPDDINDLLVASLGTFIVRVHSGETVAIGDYLQSKGDGTAKVQADDVMRASTVAKVISTEKTITHGDGSYCVPCTLHCG